MGYFLAGYADLSATLFYALTLTLGLTVIGIPYKCWNSQVHQTSIIVLHVALPATFPTHYLALEC